MFTPSYIGSLFKNKSSFKASQSDEILPSSTGQSDEILPSTTGQPTASRSKSLESAVIICAVCGGVFVLVLGVTWHVKKKRMLNNIKRKLKVLWIHRSMEFNQEFLHWDTHMNGHEADVVCSLVEPELRVDIVRVSFYQFQKSPKSVYTSFTRQTNVSSGSRT